VAGSQTPGPVGIEIRPLTTPPQFREAVALQKITWGFADIELIPVRVFVTAQFVGGQTIGAYDRDRMVGFCLSIPGVKQGGKGYLHSHMLAVADQYRNRGLGRRLKLAQRDDALSRGIELMEWTFDPFEIKNAYFNLERLGAMVTRFVPNMYGTTSSPLHGGLPTDRCIVQWWMSTDRVERILKGERDPRAAARAIAARVPVPPVRTAESQQQLSIALAAHLSSGLAATGFERTTEGGNYLLSLLG
jgi:predicted GNAT superfamily acetyltransferase